MKRAALLSLVLVVSLTAATGPAQPAETNEPNDPKAELLWLDLGILIARMRPAPAPGKAPQITLPEKVAVPDLSEALAEEYSRIDARGQVITRQAELEKSRGKVMTQPCQGYIRDMRIHLLENAAVVRSLIRVESCDNRDYEPPGQYRVTNLYAKRQGQWRLMSSHWTTIANG
jgi:hypothetical protein